MVVDKPKEAGMGCVFTILQLWLSIMPSKFLFHFEPIVFFPKHDSSNILQNWHGLLKKKIWA